MRLDSVNVAQFKISFRLHFISFSLELFIRVVTQDVWRPKKARCQVVLNEEQTDVFALWPGLDAAPCKKILAAV